MQGIAGLLGLVLENLVGIVLFFVSLQLIFCYAVQTIADKQDVPHSWMAWVPILQLYPMIKPGGSFAHFLLLIAAGIAAIVAGSLLGPLGAVLVVAWSAGALVYFVQLVWNTAENRGVPGWVGLLAFLPLVNVAAYLFIAFHDGLVAPSKVGLLLGVLCFVLPALPEARKARELAQLGKHLGPMAAAAEREDEAAVKRTLLEMMETMQGMEGLEPSGAEAEAMAQALEELSATLQQEIERAPDAQTAPPGERALPPVEDIPALESVSELFRCPEGTRERGAAPPRGFERWCERVDASRGRLHHGGYASWHPNGQLQEVGIYRDGERVGVWTRWHASGGKQTQAEFEDGVQHGLLLRWDEFGRQLDQIRYRQGTPLGS
ncbi:MAG: hypothetical protein OEM49_08320 [Myxococcales bacterium]|nr:hypothetical protein [Myxococcales bacterium]MDH5307365.1 hypothetical protein [Myxococcales bacterium]MDH5566191.1 hypothetical protein [Myxococcales bacterium]